MFIFNQSEYFLLKNEEYNDIIKSIQLQVACSATFSFNTLLSCAILLSLFEGGSGNYSHQK